MPVKFKYCPKCASLDLISIDGKDYYFCRSCEYKGCVLEDTPDYIEAYKNGFPEDSFKHSKARAPLEKHKLLRKESTDN
ncbi:MAG: hypothetical protein V1494_03875 [Candidatus Diapherotrites archaeon]